MNRPGAWKTVSVASVTAGFAVLLLLSPGCTKSEGDKEPEVGSHSHAVAGETCFVCDASKREAGRLWCKEHSRYEDRCWLCQPQLEDKARAYCKEHSLYEDECFLCHPELKKDAEGEESEEEKKSSRSLRPQDSATELFCKEHRVPEAECGICQPQRTAELLPGDELKVRFESKRSAEKAGVRTVSARSTKARPSVRAVCEVSYNENKLARITPLSPGIVRRVLVDVGEDVKAGEVLVEIHSTEVASAKAAYISAVVDAALKEIACKREEGLVKKKVSSEKDLQEADAACKTAKLAESTTRQSLLNFGFTVAEISSIKEKQDSSAVFFVRAPYDGTLVERAAVVGEAAEPGQNLFTLADLSTMWLSLSIPADRMSLVEPGLNVEATFGKESEVVSHGELTWVSTSIDEKSRMLKGRAVVENPERRLRAGMFGEAHVILSLERNAIGVPKGAIQRYEKQPYVFVKLEDDLYSLRRVVVEKSSAELVAVVSGLRENEPVVVDGAFTVMSEFLKSRLGAGCVDD